VLTLLQQGECIVLTSVRRGSVFACQKSTHRSILHRFVVMAWLFLISLCLLYSLPYTHSLDQHVDSRCSCKCPVTGFVDPDIDTDWQERKIYINSTVDAGDCDCEHVVVPLLRLDKEQTDKFCPRCQCSHETRSVMTIKVVVAIILWVLSLLFVYLLYLVCIEPFLGNKGINLTGAARGRRSAPYTQQEDEVTDDGMAAMSPMAQYSSRGSARNVVNRLGVNQDRWRRQVEIQRTSVYDRHTLLN